MMLKLSSSALPGPTRVAAAMAKQTNKWSFSRILGDRGQRSNTVCDTTKWNLLRQQEMPLILDE